jgi:signal transduction histidine kinase
MLATASGLFLAAGVMRLAKWRLVHDAHSALVGSALLVMGGLCLPAGGFARLFLADNAGFAGPVARCVATYIAIGLVLRALHTIEISPRDRPHRLLPRTFLVVALVFVVMVGVMSALPDALTGQPLPRAILAALLAMGWFTIAGLAALHGAVRPWARRASPLYLGMGIAEMLRGLDLGAIGTWTFSGMLLCTCMALLAARSALKDLDEAVSVDEHERGTLAVALVQMRREADHLTIWREQLTHDAGNAMAGMRAAMAVLERYDGKVDPTATRQLRLAAIQELGHLEHLLTRSASRECEDFDVVSLVSQVGECARALGARVSVHTARSLGHGRPGDLAAVLKNLLVNAQTHAPGSRVDIRVETRASTVWIICTDDGPGLSESDAGRVFERGYRSPTSPGSGLGLYAARELMREQDGDLVLGASRSGASFILTLPAARTDAPTPPPVRVPAQRLTSPTPLDRLQHRPSAAGLDARTGWMS